MSLPQLVGLKCTTCSTPIASDFEGAFCEDCGNPIHQRCIGASKAADEERCAVCGGDPDSPIAREVQKEKESVHQAALRASSNATSESDSTTFPVSQVCPKCGSAHFTRTAPASLVAFTKDRVCNQCGTRYTPPTPVWAAVTFMLLGGGLFFGGLTNLAAGTSPFICPALFGMLIGASALALGIRSFIKPGKA